MYIYIYIYTYVHVLHRTSYKSVYVYIYIDIIESKLGDLPQGNRERKQVFGTPNV